jgi:hypothetical protein
LVFDYVVSAGLLRFKFSTGALLVVLSDVVMGLVGFIYTVGVKLIGGLVLVCCFGGDSSPDGRAYLVSSLVSSFLGGEITLLIEVLI